MAVERRAHKLFRVAVKFLNAKKFCCPAHGVICHSGAQLPCVTGFGVRDCVSQVRCSIERRQRAPGGPVGSLWAENCAENLLAQFPCLETAAGGVVGLLAVRFTASFVRSLYVYAVGRQMPF